MQNISWIVISLTLAAICVFFFSGALWLLRKKVPHEKMRKHHDVAGFMLGTIGVLYSVILGFTVINAKDHYTQAERTIHTEATMLADLYRDAGFFPEPSASSIRATLRDYVKYVLEEEWGKKDNHLKAQRTIQQLWKSYASIDLTQVKTRLWYTQSISKLDKMMDARLARHFYAEERLGSMMWCLLISGALITVSFMFFFGLENLRSQILMTGLLVSYLSFMLYLVYCLDNPFSGSQGIKPTALEQSIPLFDDLDQGNLSFFLSDQ